jgi:dienelactone hydrolase
MASRTIAACGLGLIMLGWYPVDLASADTIRIPTFTIEREPFLRGVSDGKTHVISGELELPAGAAQPVPAVILVHGAGGVQRYHDVWARELRGIGFATLIIDSFSGRGIPRIAHNLEALSVPSRVIDFNRALAALAADARIDRKRIVLMGFSHGATAGLYGAQRRFQKAFRPPDAEYAAWLLFYPYCNTRLIGDVDVVAQPIRIFHGEADDYTPIGPCRAWVERARAAGADVTLTGYANAYHGFDNPQLSQRVQIGDGMNPSRCFYVEKEGAVVLNSETGTPMTYRDPCWTRGVTTGYEPAAYAAALGAVKEFLRNVGGAK